MALMILPSSRRDSLTSSSWPCRNSWRSWRASNSSRASGLIGTHDPQLAFELADPAGRRGALGQRRALGGQRPVGLAVEVAAQGLDGRLDAQLGLGIADLEALLALAQLAQLALGVGALGDAARRARPPPGGPPRSGVGVARAGRPSSVSMTAWRSATSAAEAVGGQLALVELDATLLGRGPLLGRSGQPLVDLGQPALQELAALAHPRAAHLEVGAQRAHLGGPLFEPGPGLAHGPTPLGRLVLERPRASGSSPRGRRPAHARGRLDRPGRPGGPAAHRASVVTSRRSVSTRVRLSPAALMRPSLASSWRDRSSSARRASLHALGRRSARPTGGGGLRPRPRVGPGLGLVEGGAGGARAGGADPPARRRRSGRPSAVTTVASGWARATSSACDPTAVDHHGRRRPARRAGRRRPPGRRGRRAGCGRRGRGGAAARRPCGAGGAGAPGAEGQHRAGQRRSPSSACSERRAGVDLVDHDGGQRVAGRRLEGRLPAGVDLDQVGQRAEHARRSRPGGRRRPGCGPRRGPWPAPRPGPARRGARTRRPGGPTRPRPAPASAVGPATARPRRAPRPAGSSACSAARDLGPEPVGLGRRAGWTCRPGPSSRDRTRASSDSPRSTLDRSAPSSPRTSAARLLGGGHAVGPVVLVALAVARPGPPRPSASSACMRVERGRLERRPRAARPPGGPPRPRGWRSRPGRRRRCGRGRCPGGARPTARPGPGPARTATRTGPASRPGRRRPWR